MSIKPVLDELMAKDGRNINQIAIAYGQLKDGEAFKDKRQDYYRNRIVSTLANPDGATAEVLFRLLAALGVNAEAAIAIAASQAVPPSPPAQQRRGPKPKTPTD